MSQIRVRGIEIAYDEVGSGPAVLMLHGYPFNRSMWREQGDALRNHYRVIAPDLRGHGETTITPGPASMDEMARDIAALMEALGVARGTLCGLSMGGYVALAFYRLFPLRVRTLVLADTRAQADTEEGKQDREQQAEQVLREGMAGIADPLLPKLLARETLANRWEVVARVREMILNTKPEGAAAALRGMAQRTDQTSFLWRIIAPTLIIVGSEDRLTPPQEAAQMRCEIGGSRLAVIDGAAHVSNIERPEQFNQVLTSFLHDLGP